MSAEDKKGKQIIIAFIAISVVALALAFIFG